MWQFISYKITQYIINKIGYNYIKVLNINYLYWIPLDDIRILLSKLELLEELYALDTSIGIRTKDILLYGKLKKLAVSVEPNQMEININTDFYFNCLYSLQKLCLKFSLKKDNFDELYMFLSALKRLTELWIYDNDEENGINYERIVVNIPTINKLVIKSRRALPVLELSCWGLIKLFQCKRYEFAEEIIYESIMDRLPIEILIKISSYLNTHDIMQFCNSYENLHYLLQEKNIIRITDFSGKFGIQNINLCRYIVTNLNFKHIKILNINYIYWIPGQDLRRLLRKLENLNVLYAIDTKLGINYKDIAEYNKLKKLAVSVEGNQFGDLTITAAKTLTGLKSICLKITQKMGYNGICPFFSDLKQLEEVWIFDETESTLQVNYGSIAVLLINLRKFVIKSRTVIPNSNYDFSYSGLNKIFECKRSESSTDVVFERILNKSGLGSSIFEPAENEYERSWQIFQTLHKDAPYGPKESEVIYKTKSIKDVYFEDLNFCHTIILCNTKYVDAALKILSFKNSSKLKRLSFRSCLFQNCHQNAKEEPTSGFKRSRKGVHINSTLHPFQSVANNLKNLRELEILTCPSCTTGGVLSAYSLIGTFEYLEKLTLEIPLLLDGSFFKGVFTNCKHLESVFLFCKTQNDKFVMNLCQNLKYSQNIRHFRLDHKEIPLTKLLNSFNEIEHKKLLRIFLKCDKFRGIDNQEKPFSMFMENNPQLIFCLFIVASNTKKQNTDIQQIINKFKKGNPAKVFFVKKDISTFSGVYPIPTAHHDMIFNRTNVAVINIDEF